MILFYSIFCNHCKMLLEHIKRYDKEKTIKLVSIDDLRNKNMNIESYALPMNQNTALNFSASSSLNKV